MTFEQSLRLDTVHQDGPPYDANGKCRVWRRNGETQTWKTRPGQFRMPVKNGIRNFGQVTERSPAHAPEDCPLQKGEM